VYLDNLRQKNYCLSEHTRYSRPFITRYLQVPGLPVGPGEPWERILAGPGMDFFLKIPVGKDPGNLQVHPCSALGWLQRREQQEVSRKLELLPRLARPEIMA